MPAAFPATPQRLAEPKGENRPSLAASNAWCRDFCRRHAENFTVGSWLLPLRLREPFASIYAWCRWADDLADVPVEAQARIAALRDWEDQLRRCAAGDAEHPIYVALASTLREFDLPLTPFTDLLAAFQQDQRQDRYESFDELLQYCRLSANPVGRLVLYLGGCATPENISLSDSICTGLQLVNFWQDVGRDGTERRRIYLPAETLRQFQVDEQDIVRGSPTPAFRAALQFEVKRAEKMLRQGWPLVEYVSPELRVEVELFIRGGLAVAAAIRRQRFDVLTRRPTIGKAKKLRLFAAALWRQKVLGGRGVPA